MNQKVTSACTSINRNRLPAIYGKLLVNNERILDYGCGRYADHIYNACKAVHATYFPFDPYNQPEWKNRLTRAQLAERPATMGIMSNVLNVIDSDDAIVAAVNDACSLIADTCFLYITVYEGDRTGAGRYTGPDSYQRNLRTRDFAALLRALGFNVTIYRGMIMIPGKNPHCFHSARKCGPQDDLDSLLPVHARRFCQAHHLVHDVLKGDTPMKYYDRNGTEITDGCCIQLPNGRVREVAAIDDPLYPLGYDSTRQSWLDSGRAYPGQFGYYALHPNIAAECLVVERPAHWKEA